ncbi:MAG: hypothetical protein ABSG25_11965 [Bryobacteraceae bacterium]|jgi:hypothetical protein
MSKSEAEKETRDPVAKRLDAVIRLLMEEQLERGALKRKDHLLILDSVGLSSGEIGTILHQPSKDVASALKKLKSGEAKS